MTADFHTSGHFNTNQEDQYHQIYFEALDFVMQAINGRFYQPGYHVYQNRYGGRAWYLHKWSIKTWSSAPTHETSHLHGVSRKFSVYNVVHVLSGLYTISERTEFSGLWKVMKWLLLLPATNEQSFAAFRWVKKYLRTVLSQQPQQPQQRLNLMNLHANNDQIDRLELEKVAHEFVSGKEGREGVFGSSLDLISWFFLLLQFFTFIIIYMHYI